MKNIRYNNKVKLILSVGYILLGVVLSVLGFFEKIDEFWSGFGLSFLVVGALLLFKNIRYRTDEKYKESMDIAISDERNSFLRMKAWSWAGYLAIIISSVGAIVFKLMDREDLMMVSSFNVCFVMILYYISYILVKRKY